MLHLNSEFTPFKNIFKVNTITFIQIVNHFNDFWIIWFIQKDKRSTYRIIKWKNKFKSKQSIFSSLRYFNIKFSSDLKNFFLSFIVNIEWNQYHSTSSVFTDEIFNIQFEFIGQRLVFMIRLIKHLIEILYGDLVCHSYLVLLFN